MAALRACRTPLRQFASRPCPPPAFLATKHQRAWRGYATTWEAQQKVDGGLYVPGRVDRRAHLILGAVANPRTS